MTKGTQLLTDWSDTLKKQDGQLILKEGGGGRCREGEGANAKVLSHWLRECMRRGGQDRKVGGRV